MLSVSYVHAVVLDAVLGLTYNSGEWLLLLQEAVTPVLTTCTPGVKGTGIYLPVSSSSVPICSKKSKQKA